MGWNRLLEELERGGEAVANCIDVAKSLAVSEKEKKKKTASSLGLSWQCRHRCS